MVFSGGASTPGVQASFERTLAQQLARPVDFMSAHLDLLGSVAGPQEEALTTVLAGKYAGTRIDLVFVQRKEALDFLLRHRAALFPGVPIVFTELRTDELAQVQLPSDVTGAVISGVPATVPIALDLLPETRRVVIVAGGTAVDRLYADAAEQHVHAGWPKLEIVRLDGKSLDDQRARLATLPPHSLILFTTYRGDSSRRSMPTVEALEALSQSANAPMFGFQAHHLGFGIVGGDLVRLDVVAARAATLAARILNGEAPSAVRPQSEPSTEVAFDARQLARWNIAERRLPANSIIRFRQPTLWTTYRWQALGGLGILGVQALLIGGLVMQRRHRQRTMARLVEAEHRYRTVAEFGADWDYWALPDGSLRYVSPACEVVTGYAAADFIGRPHLMDDIIHEEDRAAWRQHCRAASTPGDRRSIEFRIRRRDGEVRWVEHICAPVSGANGADLGIRGSNRDVTSRKQAEEDRRRAETQLRQALREIEDLRERLEIDNSYMREQLMAPDDIEGILGASDAMRQVAARVRQVAPTSSSVLLLGETGVGKSLLAQAIHDLSSRRARPLITLDCAVLPPSLVESELFGHEKGAFTGAQATRLGRFEIAHGGTLFLDEVGELPIELQGKLLRAVQMGEFERVGSNVTRKTDVRLIAATNRRLDDDVRAGRFRQDLLYRLNVFPITVPPLRQRPEDIPLLVTHFIQKHCRKLAVPPPQVSRATMRALQSQPWPGNIRELENVVERALIATRGAQFDLVDVGGPPLPLPADPVADPGTRTLEQLERDYILATLERKHWQIAGQGGAAEALGINASTLRSRMQKLGIRRPTPGASSAAAFTDLRP
ncbi:sigma 54-interacting transcriptional regulator [Luteitalea sp. TBR-22]|uniref:sigma 54-interacting transcriptional regulator n=1 Tax=Luteitalea sp. TBR-22 TaxID=2802971 RepID=UPI001EF5AD66|nr:sigma 54-interacting transcriptional regulator [Luteitalea sp. TBR-22]